MPAPMIATRAETAVLITSGASRVGRREKRGSRLRETTAPADCLTREAAMARLHLRRADGSLVSGAEAFTGLWRVLPQWAWLGRVLGQGPGLWLLEAGYRVFLVVRRGWRKKS